MANKLVSQHSSLCVPSNLCLFSCPETQVSYQKGQWLTFVPAFNTDSNGPFVFHLTDSSHFLQLNKTYISFRLKLEHIDVKDTTGAPKLENTVAPAQLIGCSLFNQVRVAFNNVQLYDSTHYAYKAYLQTLLGCTTDEKQGFLSAAGWFENDAYHAIETDENKGFVARQKCFKTGEMDVCAPVLLEPFMTDRLLVPGVNMQLTFYRNSDSFILESRNAGPAVRLTVFNMKLHMRAIEVNSSCALAIESKMRTSVARYPFTDVKVKILTVPAGRMDMPFTSLYHDVVPRRLIIGLLEPDAMEGNMTKDCFNFKHFNLKELSVEAAGVVYPGQPIESDFQNKNYARTFMQLYEELGCVSENRCPPISYRQFANGQALFAVNLSALDNGTAWDMVKTGTTQLALKFGTKVPEGGINVVVFSFYDNQYCVDGFRNMVCSSKYLVVNAMVPCRERAVCPGSNTCDISLLSLIQLRGVFSPNGTHFEETDAYLGLLSPKILQAWNGYNGAPLRLPLSLTSHSAHTFRFPSRILRRNRKNCIPTLAEYIMAKYGLTVGFPDACTIIDSNGSILPIEAVQLAVNVQAHLVQMTRRAIVDKEVEICQVFDAPEHVARRRGILTTKEQEFISKDVMCKQFEQLMK